VKLRAQFDNKAQALFPNEFVNAQLLVTTLHGVTLIPTSAIQHNGDAAFVYVLQQNGKAKLQPVKPGVTNSTITEVEGIGSGTVVANSSFDKLQDGAQVKLSKMQLPGDSTETNAP